MELIVEEMPTDNSVKFKCDLCNFNPYQAWCKGSVARFHAALMKHKQSIRHKEAEAFSKGEQPVNISKGGKVSADAPSTDRPPHFYISKLETMIDKLEQRIDALNSAYEPSEDSEGNNTNPVVWEDIPPHRNSFGNGQKSGDLVEKVEKVHQPQIFDFKEIEKKAMRKFGDGSCITNTNTLNAVVRCLNWCEVYIKEDGRRARNTGYLKTTVDMIKSLCSLVAEGWRAEEEDYDAIGGRLDSIMEHQFSV